MRGASEVNNDHQVRVTVRGVAPVAEGTLLRYVAASPPDRMFTYAGSAQPFPNATVAFEGTPNRGAVRAGPGGAFAIDIVPPNSFYPALGTGQVVPPTLYVQHGDRGAYSRVRVGGGAPYRETTYPAARRGPLFNAGLEQLPVRDQDAILADAAYPAQSADLPRNFWGLKPPV